MATAPVTQNPYDLSVQDLADLRHIAAQLKPGDPRVAKVNLLINSAPTQFEQQQKPSATSRFFNAAADALISKHPFEVPDPAIQAREISETGHTHVPVPFGNGEAITEPVKRIANGDIAGGLGSLTPLALQTLLAYRAGAPEQVQAGRPPLQLETGPIEQPASPLKPPAQLTEGTLEGEYVPMAEKPPTPLTPQLKSGPIITPEPQSSVAVQRALPPGVPDEIANIYRLRNGWKDNFEDAQIRQAMEEDLNRQLYTGIREQRAEAQANAQSMGIGVPKWQRVASEKAQAILDEAQQRANAVMEEARQQGERGIFAKVPQDKLTPKTASASLEDLLQKSIEQAKAKKAGKGKANP